MIAVVICALLMVSTAALMKPTMRKVSLILPYATLSLLAVLQDLRVQRVIGFDLLFIPRLAFLFPAPPTFPQPFS